MLGPVEFFVLRSEGYAVLLPTKSSRLLPAADKRIQVFGEQKAESLIGLLRACIAQHRKDPSLWKAAENTLNAELGDPHALSQVAICLATTRDDPDVSAEQLRRAAAVLGMEWSGQPPAAVAEDAATMLFRNGVSARMLDQGTFLAELLAEQNETYGTCFVVFGARLHGQFFLRDQGAATSADTKAVEREVEWLRHVEQFLLRAKPRVMTRAAWAHAVRLRWPERRVTRGALNGRAQH